MPDIPIILVAGGETLYIELIERFPRNRCRVSYCDSVGQTLDRADSAALVVVDSAVPGGADALCRRLRESQATAHLPILLRAPGGTTSGLADEVVPDDALEELVAAIERQLPGVSAGERVDDSGFFDVETSTNAWRRMDEDESEWPPPAPQIDAGVDILESTRSYAGYVNSLYESAQVPDELAPSERRRLGLRIREVVGDMDRVLSYTQHGVNDALKGGQLGLMRDLTAARNALYDRLVALRSLDAKKIDGQVETPEEPVEETVRRSAPRIALDEQPTTRSALPALDDDPRVAESELTRQARARDAQRKARPLAPPRGRRRARRPTGGARRVEAKTNPLWALAIGVLVAGVIAVAFMFSGSAETGAADTGPLNRPPAMQYVVLQQTATGVLVKPKALDPEGQEVSYTIHWRINGADVPTPATGATRLPAGSYEQGDKVEAVVTPTDGATDGRAMISQPLEIVWEPPG